MFWLHICMSIQAIIGWGNGLSPVRHQAIISSDAAEILLNWPLGPNSNEILIEIYASSSQKMYLKMSSAKNGGQFVLAPTC